MKKCHICITAIVVMGTLAGVSYLVYSYFPTQDIDECSAGINPCGVNALCLNTPSGYSCLCPVGFEAKTTLKPVCEKVQVIDGVEINPTSKAVSENRLIAVGVQCLSDTSCMNNTICIDGTCRCPSGFHGQGGLCLDTNECLNYACGPHAVCTNLPAGYRCICKLGATGNPPQTPCEVTLCPKNYFQVGSQCFFRPKVVSMSWDSAQRWCKEQGAFLAQPQSIPDFREVLIASVSSRHYGFWLGASDRAQSGVWKWSSNGFRVGNSDSWLPGEPNNAEGKEDCLFLVKDRTPPLDDRNCHDSYYFICEKDLSKWKYEYEYQKFLVTPEISCHSDKDCIEGLDCKNNFCHCPEGCDYIANIASCDCGDYYDSDAYWRLSFVWPSIVGTFAGLMITCFWCICICETNSRMAPDDDVGETGEEQSLNPLPTEMNQSENHPQTVVNEPVDVPVVDFSAGKPFSPDQYAVTPQKQASAPPLPVDTPSTIGGLSYYSPPDSGAALPYSLDSGSKADGPSTFTSSSYPTNPPPFAPQPYGVQPYDPQPSAATSASYYLPPPSYMDALADKSLLGEEEDTSSVTLKYFPSI